MGKVGLPACGAECKGQGFVGVTGHMGSQTLPFTVCRHVPQNAPGGLPYMCVCVCVCAPYIFFLLVVLPLAFAAFCNPPSPSFVSNRTKLIHNVIAETPAGLGSYRGKHTQTQAGKQGPGNGYLSVARRWRCGLAAYQADGVHCKCISARGLCLSKYHGGAQDAGLRL